MTLFPSRRAPPEEVLSILCPDPHLRRHMSYNESRCVDEVIMPQSVSAWQADESLSAVTTRHYLMEEFEKGVSTGNESMMLSALSKICHCSTSAWANGPFLRHPAWLQTPHGCCVGILDVKCKQPPTYRAEPFDQWHSLTSYILAHATRARAQPLELSSQPTEMARAHLTKRPFQVSSLSIVFIDRDFYVVQWDRSGAVVSPRYGLQERLSLFVRLVLQFARGMPAHSLGTDPSTLVEDGSKISITQANFQVRMFDCTAQQEIPWRIEHPISTPCTLVGQATAIWRVRSLDGSKVRVLKSYWRVSNRSPESSRYLRLISALRGAPWPVGLCGYDGGHDAYFCTPTRYHTLLNTTLVRFGPKYGEKHSRVLHRILLKDEGYPLDSYTTPVQLMEGFRDAIKGHRRLTELGFLHGDVSAGNILLAIDPIAQGHAGFLVDFEFLKEYPKQTQFVGTVEVQPHFSWPSLS